MVACVISPRVGDTAPARTVEELEVDHERPTAPTSLPSWTPAAFAPSTCHRLSRGAAEAVDRSGSALLRVERLPGDEAHATVLAGLPTDAEATAIERAAQFVEPTAVLAPRL